MKKETESKPIEDIFSSWKPRNKFQEIIWWLQYGIWTAIIDFPSEVKYFIQRGKRGYSDRDVWDLHFYLSEVIYNSLKHLKKHKNGYPSNLTSKKWGVILNKIIKSFEVGRKISAFNWFYLPPEERTEENIKKYRKFAKNLSKESREKELNFLDEEYRFMTERECKQYEEGWELFRKYYFHLWD